MATRYNFLGGIVTEGLIMDLDAAKMQSYPAGGTDWIDISGNVNNGTLVNGPAFSGVGKQAAIVFDGTNDRVTIPYTIQNQYINQLSGFVWSNPQWFNTGNNDGVALISKSYTSLNQPYTIFGLGFSSSGQYGSNVGNGITRISVNSAESVSLNTWVYLGFTYDGTTLKLYKNGIQDVNTITGTYTIGQNTLPVYIGSNAPTLTGYEDFFKGNISNVSLYNRALTQAEITQNFNALRGRYSI